MHAGFHRRCHGECDILIVSVNQLLANLLFGCKLQIVHYSIVQLSVPDNINCTREYAVVDINTVCIYGQLLSYCMLCFLSHRCSLVQMAVCVLELLPEARKCKEDMRLIQGFGFGSVIMLATLWAGV